MKTQCQNQNYFYGMPIELMFTDSEIVKMHKKTLFKKVLTKEDLNLLSEIKAYMDRK